MPYASIDTAAPAEWTRIREAERQRRERERMLAEQRDMEVTRAATPQTLRKFRKEVIAKLRDADKITREQATAAREIAGIFYALTAEVMPRISRYDPERAGGITRDWKPSLSRSYTECYVPWRDEMGSTMLGHRVTLFDLVAGVAIDNNGLRQVAQHLHIDKRTVLERLRIGLHRYAEIAGWLEDRPGSAPGAMRSVEICDSAEIAA